ncbi:MAG: carbohydrate kinase family protein [Chloroflexi bacterium]|nr:carbohydrate kinase family protein [Chloroflexota bacterium]
MTDFIPSVDADLPVLVLGAAGIDVIGRIEADLRPATSNPARIRRSYGGVARNVAENLARLGQPVRLLTVVGEDEAGREMLAHTAEAGVDMSAIIRTSEYPTGFYMGVVDSVGALQFAVDDMRLLEEMTPHYLQEQEALFKSSSLVFVDANLPAKTLRAAVNLARRARIPICADPTSTALAAKLTPLLPKLFLVTPNGKEASVLTGLSLDSSERKAAREAARQAARLLVSQGVGIALVALAEFGVVYATTETTGHIPAIRTRISDPTGAGDALTAAVLFGLLNDIPLDDAIRLGVSAASLTLRHPGSVYPDLSLEALYDQLLV